ncbi:ATP-dependent DNA helicase HFM1 [Carpediemonas membranifera]|uniref:DNA 3'-5' helicase n=1 Tax=Carpediemonas membranifera TaxID=201153 RepID=A0A8J6AZC8_9EUKA|nr:ATP-dependent DNA helicase HFM1 [Carpediemonas membranifera]|eukprot:KAG9390949.1 ATP-dependent DNA helicase HFM1 [Carpediemonas membranifera]
MADQDLDDLFGGFFSHQDMIATFPAANTTSTPKESDSVDISTVSSYSDDNSLFSRFVEESTAKPTPLAEKMKQSAPKPRLPQSNASTPILNINKDELTDTAAVKPLKFKGFTPTPEPPKKARHEPARKDAAIKPMKGPLRQSDIDSFFESARRAAPKSTREPASPPRRTTDHVPFFETTQQPAKPPPVRSGPPVRQPHDTSVDAFFQSTRRQAPPPRATSPPMKRARMEQRTPPPTDPRLEAMGRAGVGPGASVGHVSVQPSVQPPLTGSNVPDGCLPISVLPAEYQAIFPYPCFNRVQSEAYSAVMDDGAASNIILSAPTGSGKTTIFELAMLHLVMRHGRLNGAHKIIYLAPIKALCQERFEDWKERLCKPLGITAVLFTGDVETYRLSHLTKADLIIATPEKWDSATRKYADQENVVGFTQLLLIDEIHLLNENRGPTLESLVARLRTLGGSPQFAGSALETLRTIAVSATIPNIEDIAAWLGVRQTGLLKFDQSYRPVPLERRVLAYPEAKSEFLFDRNLDYKIADVVTRYAEGKPTLIFCSTRKGTVQTAQTLARDCELELRHPNSTTEDQVLSELMRQGVGFHHAGLSMSDRRAVESAFIAGKLSVLCTTSTLALGVNLPARLVIIKGTTMYNNGRWEQYDAMRVQQMVGRAGRPQFDHRGVAVVMTSADQRHRYEDIVNENVLVESGLHATLAEHLNAEVVIGTVGDRAAAVSWLRHTFYFIRALRVPARYGLPGALTPDAIQEHLLRVVDRALERLIEAGLVVLDGETGAISPTEAGRTVCRFYVALDTVAKLMELPTDAGLLGVLEAVSQAKEFEQQSSRMSERKTLNALSKKVRFPYKKSVKTGPMKVCTLLQADLQSLDPEEFALRTEMFNLRDSAHRILMCARDLFVALKRPGPALSAAGLSKGIASRLWPDADKGLLRQLDGVGPVMVRNLAEGGVTSFDHVAQASTIKLEHLCSRNPPFGTKLRDQVGAIGRVTAQLTAQPYDGDCVELKAVLSVQTRPAKPQWLLLLVTTHDTVALSRRISTGTADGVEVRCLVPTPTESPEISVDIIHDSVVGADWRGQLVPQWPKPVMAPQPKEKEKPKPKAKKVDPPTPKPTPRPAPPTPGIEVVQMVSQPTSQGRSGGFTTSLDQPVVVPTGPGLLSQGQQWAPPPQPQQPQWTPTGGFRQQYPPQPQPQPYPPQQQWQYAPPSLQRPGPPQTPMRSAVAGYAQSPHPAMPQHMAQTMMAPQPMTAPQPYQAYQPPPPPTAPVQFTGTEEDDWGDDEDLFIVK